MLDIAIAAKFLVTGIALAWIARVIASPQRRTLHIVWAVFCGSMAAVMIREVFGDAVGPLRPLLVIASCGTCSVFWLVARALFRASAPIGPAQLLLVGGIFAPTVIDQALLALSATGSLNISSVTGLTTALDRFQSLLSSTVLILSFWEGIRGWSAELPVNERRLRILYLATFGLCVSTCVMLLNHGRAPLNPETMAAIQASCALAIIAVISVAIHYRNLHPVPSDHPVGIANTINRAATDSDRQLGQRIEDLLVRESIYLDPDLKVASLARRLHEPDYRISRAITAGLGQPNFNQLVNRYRIEHAKRLLRSDTSADQPILNIALDSGFASLGPFNRSFKTMTGMTPRTYRNRDMSREPAELAAE